MERQSARILAVIGVWGVLLLFVTDVPRGMWQYVFGGVWFVSAVAALILFGIRGAKSFVCPDCGGPVSGLLETDGRVGTPLLRHCPKCDVLWKVGVESDS